MAHMQSRLAACPSISSHLMDSPDLGPIAIPSPIHPIIGPPPGRPVCLRRDGMLAYAHPLEQLIAFSTGTRFGSPSFRTWARLGGSWTTWLSDCIGARELQDVRRRDGEQGLVFADEVGVLCRLVLRPARLLHQDYMQPIARTQWDTVGPDKTVRPPPSGPAQPSPAGWASTWNYYLSILLTRGALTEGQNRRPSNSVRQSRYRWATYHHGSNKNNRSSSSSSTTTATATATPPHLSGDRRQ